MASRLTLDLSGCAFYGIVCLGGTETTHGLHHFAVIPPLSPDAVPPAFKANQTRPPWNK